MASGHYYGDIHPKLTIQPMSHQSLKDGSDHLEIFLNPTIHQVWCYIVRQTKLAAEQQTQYLFDDKKAIPPEKVTGHLYPWRDVIQVVSVSAGWEGRTLASWANKSVYKYWGEYRPPGPGQSYQTSEYVVKLEASSLSTSCSSRGRNLGFGGSINTTNAMQNLTQHRTLANTDH